MQKNNITVHFVLGEQEEENEDALTGQVEETESTGETESPATEADTPEQETEQETETALEPAVAALEETEEPEIGAASEESTSSAQTSW